MNDDVRTFLVEILLRAREQVSGAVSKASTEMRKLTQAQRDHTKASKDATDKMRGEVTELERLHAAHVREKRDLDEAAASRRRDAAGIREHSDVLRQSLATSRAAQSEHANEAARLADLAKRREDDIGKVDRQVRAYRSQAAEQRRLANQHGQVAKSLQSEVSAIESRARAFETDARAIERNSAAVGRALRGTASRIADLNRRSREMEGSRRTLRSWFADVRQGARDSEVNLSRLSSSFKGFQIAFVIKYAQALLSALIGLAGALFSVAANAAQAGAALVGSLTGGAAQALPVIGLMIGVIVRLTAVMKALQLQQLNQLNSAHAQTQAAESIRNANERVINAEEALAAAHRATTDARRGLTKANRDATRELEDLIDAELRAKQAVEGADLSLEDAKARLRQAISTGRGEDVAQAQLDVQSARLGRREVGQTLTRSRQDLAIRRSDGSDTLRQATQQLADARRNETRAVRDLAVARHDAAFAASKETAATDRLQQMLKLMTPAERALFRAMTKLQDDYKKAFRPITDIVIEAFTRAVRRVDKLLGDPVILGGFRRIARAVAKSIDELTKFGTSGSGRSLFDFLTREAARNIPRITKIVERLFNIFKNFARAGAPAFRDLLGLVDGLAGKAEKASSKTNKLSDFFKTGIRYLRSWLNLGLAVVRLLLALSGAGGAAEGLKSIDAATAGIDRLTGKIDKNRHGVRQFFADSRRVAGEVLSVLGAIAREVIGAFSPSNVHNFADFLKAVVIPALGNTIVIMGKLTSAAHFLLALPVVSEIAQWAATFLLLAKGLTIIRSALIAMRIIQVGFIATFGLLPAAILAVVAAIIILDRKFHFLAPTFAFIKRIAIAAFGAIKDAAKDVADFFADSWDHGLLRLLRYPFEFFIKFWPRYTPFGIIISHAKDIIGFFSGAGSGAWGAIKDLLTLPFRVDKEIIKTNFEVIRGIITTILDLIRGDFSGAKDAFIGIFKAMGNGIKNVWLAIFKTIYGIVATVINAVISGVNKAISVFNKLPGPNIGKISFHMVENLEALQTLHDAESGQSTSNIPVDKKAQGDMMRARPGGHHVIVGEEPGHDEVILSSNPRYARRTQKLLSRFLSAAPHVMMMARGGYVQGAIPPTGHNILNLLAQLFRRGFNVTSAFRSNSTTYHGAGLAADFGDSANNLQSLWSLLYPNRRSFAELFGPLYLQPGGGLYHGVNRFADPALQATHQDHIHVAMLDVAVQALKGLRSTVGAIGSVLPAFFRRASTDMPGWLDSVVGHKPTTGNFASGALQAIWRLSRSSLRAMYDQLADSIGPSDSAPVSSNFAANRRLARRMLERSSLNAPGAWQDMDYILSHESGYDPTISYGGGHSYVPGLAYGIPQALPGNKMASAGPDWRTNPATQLRWFFGYVKSVYHSLAAAAAFWRRNHSYSAGGSVMAARGMPVPSILHGDEHVWTADEVQRAGGHGVMRMMRRMLGGGGQGGPHAYQDGGVPAVTGSAPQGPGGKLDQALASFMEIVNEMLSGASRSKNLAARIRRAFNRLLEDGGPFDRMSKEIEAIGTRGARALQEAQFSVTDGRPTRRALDAVQVGQRELGTLGRQRAGLEDEQLAAGEALKAAQRAYRIAQKSKNQKAAQEAKARIAELTKTQDDVRTALAQNAEDMVAKQEEIQQSMLDAVTNAAQDQSNLIDRQERLATALGRAIDPSEIAGKRIKAMSDQITALQQVAAEATKSGNTDLAKQINDQIDELQVSIAEAAAQQFQAAIDKVNNTAQDSLASNDLALRMADIGGTNYSAKQTALQDRDNILQQQRQGLSDLLAQAVISGNIDKADELRKSIDGLDVTIAENSQAIKDNTNAAFAQRVSDIETRSGFAGSVSSGAVTFFQTLGKMTGQDFTSTINNILGTQGTALGTERQGLTGALADLLGYTPGEKTNLQALDPQTLVSYLLTITSGPGFDAIMARLDPTQQEQFRSLITALFANANATNENTQAIMDNTAAATGQDFSTTAWQLFRNAIFNGNGGLLPQYASLVPRAATGGWITQEGVLYGHVGEEIVPAGRGRGEVFAPQITNHEHTEDMDAETLANRLWFRWQTRPKSG